MEKRVVLELRGKKPSQIRDLNLDNCRSTTVVGLTDEFVNLEILSLNNVGLTTLKGFPKLPKLRKLELSDNRISNGLNFLSICEKISYLNLSGNKIKDLEALQPLEQFKNLKTLDLFNNEVTNLEGYRAKVFALHPSLKNLDGFDKLDCEADDSDDEEEMNGNNDSDDEEEEEEEGLCAVYRDNLEEESSGGSLYEGSDDDDDEDDDDDDGEENDDEHNNTKAQDGENEDSEPEESTRGKKRKHEDEEEN